MPVVAKSPFAVVGTLRSGQRFLQEAGLDQDYELLVLDNAESLQNHLLGRYDVPYIVLSDGRWFSELIDYERAGRLIPWSMS